jgi:transposase
MAFTRSKAFSEDLRKVLVHMYHKCNKSAKDIEYLTGLKSQTIQRALKFYESNGCLMPSKPKAQHTGKLDINDMDVSFTLILYWLNAKCGFLAVYPGFHHLLS